MLEGKFNQVMVKSIKACGIFSYKTADKYQFGVPDIYVSGGVWVEGKVVQLGSRNWEMDLYRKMTQQQKDFCQDLIDHGDFVLVAIRLEFREQTNLMIVPYTFLKKNPTWRNNVLRTFPEIMRASQYDVGHIFNSERVRNIEVSWYEKNS